MPRSILAIYQKNFLAILHHHYHYIFRYIGKNIRKKSTIQSKMNKKSVYTCETCSALYVCLKYFQEHRKKHAIQEGRTIYPCTHCQTVHTSEHESHLHSMSHKNEPPHSCEICQEMLGISEAEFLKNGRRSIGTATDFHVFNLSLDRPIINNHIGKNNIKDEDDEDDDNGDDHEDEVDDNDDEGDDEDDDEEDEDEEDEDEDEEDDEEDEETEVVGNKQHIDLAKCKPNVTNIIYVTNQTINHTTTSQQKNYLKPSRPSRSTGKGKGNRKARLTSDGDIRRKFSCCHCGKSFKTKSHLQRHILTHTGEKPYHCNRCDCRFNQSSSLRNHVIAIHTKEYPHTCNSCSKGFLMPAVLQKHLQSTECGKSNQVVEGLNEETRVHM